MNNMNVDYVTLHYRSVLNDFSNQFLNEEFSDCILNAEGRSLKVHKAMLCAQSSFLKKMILEHQNIGDLCFIIEGVSFDDLKSVVQFMYNGSAKLYKQNFGSFLVVAELLGVKWLDRIQILSDIQPSSEVVMNGSEQDQAAKPVNMETQQISAFKDITNSLVTKGIKRKKHMKSRKHCKRSKCAKEDHKNDCKKHKVNTFRHGENRGKETHLADMDENTFCTALGLKKNEIQPRENSKPDSVSETDVKLFTKSKSVPPLIKINREIKSSVESYETRDSNMFVSEINTVYIEDRNLSFLNIGANELCIRENNIEIECDVLDASSSQFVIEKEPVTNIVELREENIIQAEFVNINPACEDSSSYSDSTTHESVTSLAGSVYSESGPSSGACAPPSSSSSSTVAVRKSSRPCRRKTCSAFAATASSTLISSTGTAKKTSSSNSNNTSSTTIDKTYLEGSTLFWCDVCQRTYHTKTGLNQHKRYECCKEPAFACPRCEKRFKRKSSLVRHAITLHDEAIFPTRTKLLSKLTGQGDRSILTIAERAVAKVEPKDTEERSSALMLQLDNSDWSSSPDDSNSSMCDGILTPVSYHDSSIVCEDDCTVEADDSAVPEVNDRKNAPVADISEESVAGVSDGTPSDDSDELVTDEPATNASAALIVDDERTDTLGTLAISENCYGSEPKLAAIHASADQSPISYVEPDCGTISDNDLDRINVGNAAESSAIIVEEFLIDENTSPVENDSSQHELDVNPHEYAASTGSGYIDLSSGSMSPLSDDIGDPYEAPKLIEIITLDEEETEIDCGVQPLLDLPDLPVEIISQPSPDPIIPSPPRPRIEPLHQSVTTTPLVIKKVHKPIKTNSTCPEDVAKQGSVIIRHRGKILRKSSRTKKKRTAQPKDSFQDYLEKTFELKSFVIRLNKYRVGNEPNETEKLDFLSNFNLKKKGVFPLYSEHAYALSKARKSPQTKLTLKNSRSERSKFRKVDRKSKVMRKNKQENELKRFNFTRAISTVEIERLDDDAYCRESSIREEHSYNFRENEQNLSGEFSLTV